MNSISKTITSIFTRPNTGLTHRSSDLQQWRGIRVKILNNNLERGLTYMQRIMQSSGIERMIKNEQLYHIKNSEKRILAKKNLQRRLKSQDLARKLLFFLEQLANRSLNRTFYLATFYISPKMKYFKPLSLYQELLKVRDVERGRFLGLDVGDKYVGLAVSDFNNKVASPLSVLVRKKSNIGLMAIDFQHLMSELSLSAFVVGYPYVRKSYCPEAAQVKAFVDELSQTGKLEDVQYTYWEECFTTKNTELLLKPLNIHPLSEAKTISDKFAAVGILQGYLDYVNRNVATEQSQ